MKAVLTFNLSDAEDQAKFNRCTKADACYSALWQISQLVFRPARKHGYSGHPTLNKLLETEAVAEAIQLLETMFWGILNEEGVDLDDWS